MTLREKQNVMESIEDCSERLDLLEKTLAVEEKQKKRKLDLAIQKKREDEESSKEQLHQIPPTTQSLLDQEVSHRKSLVDAMVRESSPSNAPVVKVLSNITGNKLIQKKMF